MTRLPSPPTADAAVVDSGVGVDALVEQHLSLARRVAASLYAHRHVAEHSFDDFHQLALVGLVEAARRFDPSHGVAFEAFAATRVRGSVLNGVRALSEKQEQIAMRARLVRERTESLRPAAQESVDAFDSLVTRTIGLAIGHMLEDSGMFCTGEPAAPDSGYERVELRQLAQRVLQCLALLPPREQHLLRAHYLHGELFDSVAAEWGLTKGRVSQLHRQAIERLRQLCAEHGMRDIRL